jgi:5-methylcytosine-specific restriction endonuclease McrA
MAYDKTAYSAGWYQANKDRLRLAHKANYQAHLEERRAAHRAYRVAHAAEMIARALEWQAAHKEHRQRYTREWRAANRERIVAVRKARKTSHPERVLDIQRKYKSTRRAREASAFIEPVSHAEVYARANGICNICGLRVTTGDEWEVDHEIPLARGGVHSYDNARLAHKSCNRRKHTALPQGQPTLFQVKASTAKP